MKAALLGALVATCTASAGSVRGVPAYPPVIQTTYGPVQGTWTDDGVAVFHSIPFAAPPVGDLRLRAPQPPTPWTDVRDVSAINPGCPQLKLDGDLFWGQEDCLYLNVYVPPGALDPSTGAANASLPVMFFIFGGGLMLGDGTEFGFYEGANFARNHNTLVVAPNYRVGFFGFGALAALQEEDPNHSAGNMGLQDQGAALEWVQANIGAFGGDKSKVAIFGESAGGFSVCAHVVRPASAGLFSAAIMESGSCDTPQFFQHLDFAIAWNTLYAASFGCNATAMSNADFLACVRSKSANDLQKSLLDWLNPNWPFTSEQLQGVDPADAAAPGALNMTRYFTGPVGVPSALAPATLPALAPFMPWGFAVDGTDVGVPDVPLARIQAGNFSRVPFLMGTNLNEGMILLPFFPLVVKGTSFPPTDAQLPSLLEHALDMFNATIVANVTATVLEYYPRYPLDNNWARGSDVITHMFFTCSARRAARAVAAQGVPAYLYQFNHPNHWLEGVLLGDYHTIELPYVFGNQWPPILHLFDQTDFELSNGIGTYWRNMAYTGSPNEGPAGAPVPWPAYEEASDLNLQLTIPFNITTGLLKDKCDMWDAVFAKLGVSASEWGRHLAVPDVSRPRPRFNA